MTRRDSSAQHDTDFLAQGDVISRDPMEAESSAYKRIGGGIHMKPDRRTGRMTAL